MLLLSDSIAIHHVLYVVYREYRVRSVTIPSSSHETGRNCDQCQSPLVDTIIKFGETLRQRELEFCVTQAMQADFGLVLGTSLYVHPFQDFVTTIVDKPDAGMLAICNLQPTPVDSKAALLLRTTTDHLMELLCEELGVEIPLYEESKELQVTFGPVDEKTSMRSIQVHRPDNASLDEFVRSVSLSYNSADVKVLESEPFQCLFPASPCTRVDVSRPSGSGLGPSAYSIRLSASQESQPPLRVHLTFGNREDVEPLDLVLEGVCDKKEGYSVVFKLVFSLSEIKWRVVEKESTGEVVASGASASASS